MKTMRNKKGFTLIELIIIIVILGVLAAVAIPKYIDLKRDAAGGVAQGIVGSLNAVDSMLFSKYLIGSLTTYDLPEVKGNITLPPTAGWSGNTITGISGYTCSFTITTARNLNSSGNPAMYSFGNCSN